MPDEPQEQANIGFPDNHVEEALSEPANIPVPERDGAEADSELTPMTREDIGQVDPEDGVEGNSPSDAPEIAFSWQASEFVHHHKNFTWYAILFAALACLIGVAIMLHSWLEIGVFIAVGAVIVVYAQKAPRTLTYELSSEGIHIDGKLYGFEAFRSFAVMQDEEWHSVDLEPTKRLSPRVVLLFDPADIDNIVGHLELHIPRHDRELDTVEKITRYLRF